MRKIQEPYRQAFGARYTKKYGRPIGWSLFTSAFEKVCFPTIIVVMMILGWWKFLGITIIIETAFALLFLTIIAKGQRYEYFLKGILITPIRYLLIDIWISKNRNWRK